MGLLMTIYTVCATRTNLPFFLVLLGTAMTFILLAAAYWKLGEGNMVVGNRLTVVSLEYPVYFHGQILTLETLGCWRCSILRYYIWLLFIDCPGT